MEEQQDTCPSRLRSYFRMDRSPSAIKSLDGLRGIAIILVLLRHAVRPFYHPTNPSFTIAGWDPMIPCLNGWMGVDLFFVLSGFLVTYHLLKRAGREVTFDTIREYLTKRFLRIVPAYYVFLLLVAVGAFPFYTFPREELSQQLAQHLLFLQDYFGAKIVVAFWSLGVEEKFYFSAPFLVLVLLKIQGAAARVRFLSLLIAIPLSLRLLTYFNHPEIATYQELFWTLRSPFHLAADALLMGSMCALLAFHRDEFKWIESRVIQRSCLLAGCAIVGGLLFASPLLNVPSLFNGTVLFPLLGVGFALVLFSLVMAPKDQRRLLDNRGLFFFSKISYSLYLVHMVFVDGVLALLNRWSMFGELSPAARFVVYFPVFTGVSIVAALVLHYAVEKPFLIVKDRYRVTPSRAGTTVNQVAS